MRILSIGILLFGLLIFLFGFKDKEPSFKNNFFIKSDKSELYKEIYQQDSMLFKSFNERDIEKMKLFFDTSLELYQDNTGVRNYQQTIDAFMELFKKDYVLTRILVAGSLEVYPIKDFGAIETGVHRFSHVENGKSETGTFKFMHIWKKMNGGWKITRLITYDH